MHVVLSIDSLNPPVTGIGRYTLELARALREQPSVSISYLARYRLLNALPDRSGEGYAVTPESRIRRLARAAIANSNIVSCGASFSMSAIQGIALESQSPGNAVYHGPNFYLPRFFRLPSIVTFHDISVYSWAQCHPPERIRYMRSQIAWSLKRADLILTDSESVRKEVVEYFNYPSEKVRAIPLASSGVFRPRSEEACEGTLQEFGLRYKGYCFYSGTIEPRKNVDALLDAYARLPEVTRRNFPLVICGFAGWKSDETHARIREYVREGWVQYLGYVAADALPIIMSGARLFVFPSHYEGFGLPILEAMASGVPVLCSDIEVLREVGGDAATYVEPDDVDKFTQTLEQCLDDKNWHELTKLRGLSHSRRYSWEHTAQLTIQAYEQAAN